MDRTKEPVDRQNPAPVDAGAQHQNFHILDFGTAPTQDSSDHQDHAHFFGTGQGRNLN